MLDSRQLFWRPERQLGVNRAVRVSTGIRPCTANTQMVAMKPTTSAKRRRVTSEPVATRLPTYGELEQSLIDAEAKIKHQAQIIEALLAGREAELARLRDELATFKRKEEAKEVKSEEELQGERWRELFLSPDIFREHIAPKLGEGWTAVLREACGQARSWPLPRGERKVAKVEDAMMSLPMLRWSIDRGLKATDLKQDHAAEAAWSGSLDVLRYLHEKGCPWNEDTCGGAAQGGHLTVLQWAREHGCPWNETTCVRSAWKGHLDVLQWGRANGCPWNEDTCWCAAQGGHLHVLQWAHENGCPWDERTCKNAAGKGHLRVLQWARENGCPWNEDTCWGAAQGGHLDMLQWARKHGCPWNEETCSEAAGGGHLNVLQWARANGCPWDEHTCEAAAEGGHLYVLQWARENGCPWYRTTCRRLASDNQHHHVVAWIDAQPE